MTHYNVSRSHLGSPKQADLVFERVLLVIRKRDDKLRDVSEGYVLVFQVCSSRYFDRHIPDDDVADFL